METRRTLLARLALGLGVAACGGGRLFAQPAERAVYAAIETSAHTGLSQARFFSATGASVATAPLDFRAHGLCEDGDRIVVFPRRPGNRFAVMDGTTLEIVAHVSAPQDKHFYGHGAFTRDGKHLLVTENDLETLAGGIGIYEAKGGFRRVGQVVLPGSGPHEIVRDPQRDIFYVALGGLQTHPAYGRTPLNLGDFRSQIVVLEHDTGAISPMGFWSGTEGVSLRHLSVTGEGRMMVGGQLVDAARGSAQNVLWHVAGGAVDALEDGVLLDGYVSSVASYGQRTVVTSKESGCVLTFNGATLERSNILTGASAAAFGSREPIASGYAVLRLGGVDVAVSDQFEFDNHGLSLRAT
ncbi:MAG: DUF1513 domain-containing protein [Pseudomonadota bacterium]